MSKKKDEGKKDYPELTTSWLGAEGEVGGMSRALFLNVYAQILTDNVFKAVSNLHDEMRRLSKLHAQLAGDLEPMMKGVEKWLDHLGEVVRAFRDRKLDRMPPGWQWGDDADGG